MCISYDNYDYSEHYVYLIRWLCQLANISNLGTELVPDIESQLFSSFRVSRGQSYRTNMTVKRKEKKTESNATCQMEIDSVICILPEDDANIICIDYFKTLDNQTMMTLMDKSRFLSNLIVPTCRNSCCCAICWRVCAAHVWLHFDMRRAVQTVEQHC